MNTKTTLAAALASMLAMAASMPTAATATAPAKAPALHVQEHGGAGRPLILVPGLGGGAWVWAGLLPHLQAHHQVYVVTLPG